MFSLQISIFPHLSQGEDPLFRSHGAALDHNKVIVDLAIVRESTHGSDVFLRRIKVGGGIVFDQFAVLGVDTVPHTVNLLVDLGTVMVAFLSSPGHGELDTTWMPSSDTSHLTQTFVGLPGQLLRVPSGRHT